MRANKYTRLHFSDLNNIDASLLLLWKCDWVWSLFYSELKWLSEVKKWLDDLQDLQLPRCTNKRQIMTRTV